MTAARSQRPAFRARPRPHRDDVLLATAGILGGLLVWVFGIYSTGPPPEQPYRLLSLVTLLAMASCELLRRTVPQLTIVLAAIVLVADLVMSSMLLITLLMFTDVVYAAVLYGSKWMTRVIPAASAIATVAVTALAGIVGNSAAAVAAGILAALVSIGPTWTGLIVRQHQDRAAADRLRAEQTALLAEWDRTQAVTAERARMARELHDMVANHLSAVAIHSSAALSLNRPETTHKALTVIRENSVQGLAEMRRLIGLLREESTDHAPQAAPRLDAVDTLLNQARPTGDDHGLRFVLHDRRPASAPPLPAPVELAAYRIIQESLTNALKHAIPGEVTVTLDNAPDSGSGGGLKGALTVCVVSPYGQGTGPRAPGSGAGLVGMRERAALLGGELTAGPEAEPDGRRVWRVRAVLPRYEEPS